MNGQPNTPICGAGGLVGTVVCNGLNVYTKDALAAVGSIKLTTFAPVNVVVTPVAGNKASLLNKKNN